MSAKPNGTFVWADLMPADQQRAIGFYSGVFGWNVTVGGPEFGGYATATLGSADTETLVAGINPPMPGAPPMWLAYLATSEIEATVAAVKAHGGSVMELMPGTEVMDIPTVGKMAVCTEPMGASFGLWQGESMHGFEVGGSPGAFCWTEVYSPDAAKTRDFLAAVFGYSVGTLSETPEFTYYQLTVPGQGAASVGVMQLADVPPSFALYLQVENADETAKQAVAAGGELVRGPETTPFGRLAELKDSEGATVKLMGLNAG